MRTISTISACHTHNVLLGAETHSSRAVQGTVELRDAQKQSTVTEEYSSLKLKRSFIENCPYGGIVLKASKATTGSGVQAEHFTIGFH